MPQHIICLKCKSQPVALSSIHTRLVLRAHGNAGMVLARALFNTTVTPSLGATLKRGWIVQSTVEHQGPLRDPLRDMQGELGGRGGDNLQA